MKALINIILLMLVTNHALADPAAAAPALKQYNVEIIIFEDSQARYINSQSWDQIPNTIITPEEINKPDLKITKPSILENDYKRLNTSNEFNVLFYSSWIQTGLSNEKAFNIDIKTLKNIHNTSSNNAITGNLKLVLARYLHLYGNLNYLRKDTVIDETTKLPVSINNAYPMNIHRKMRSKELHYIDHPLVGILVQINPVDLKIDKNNSVAVTN